MKLFWHRMLKRNKSYTAVDMGASEIKLAEIRVQGKSAYIKTMERVRTPEGAFSKTLSVDQLSLAVKELVESTGLSSKEVITAVSGEFLIARHIRMPKMPVHELEKAIMWEAETFIPLPVKDFLLRYVNLKEVMVNGNKYLHILLVAVPTEIIYSYLEIFARAGLEVTVIDIQPFALWRVFLQRNPSEGALAVIDMGGQTSHLIISEQGRLCYTRNLSFNGKQLTASIDSPPFPIDAASNLEETAPAALEGLRQLAGEIKRSLDFYKVQERGNAVKKIITTGGVSKLNGLETYLSEELGLSVVRGGPDLAVSERKGLAMPVDPAFSVAVGLAMREVPKGV